MQLILLTLTLVSFLRKATTDAREEIEKRCLAGPYHARDPVSRSQADLGRCSAWHEAACCKTSFTAELSANQTENLYNFTWHRCGRLSRACESYWFEEECFYQCSPYIYQWKKTQDTGAVAGVPICASYCDRWFEACKKDLICVENVLTDFNFTIHGHNYCPQGKPCITYEEMYGHGKNLCENMWGDSFVYKPENKDSSNCFVLNFNGPNTNKFVKKQVNGIKALHLIPSLVTFMICSSIFISM